ncbi:molecular chaperone Skp [Shewanella gelidii]|uniref:Molecular chaperone Skp n=2 Tax=Shewanella gelidii TaxID=1642821 RepID=A0A917N7Z9_9GAMM|nr:molecular chaperone Skp [Shewanella gelidii]
MKKMLNRVLLATVILAAPLAAQAEKLAVVDMQAIFEQLPQREEIGKAMKQEFGDRIAKVQKLQADIRGLLETQQRDAALMGESQKTELARKIDAQKSELQLEGKALDEDMRTRQGEEQNKLLVKVQKTINKIAEKENIDIVLQRGAAVYVKPSADISGKVIEALSKGK